ncbi:beta-N-acetylhexosaminidase [Marinilabiliaceae bacterium ANBcel2]|nr:beta-N-acetylhexosaminidase [Marinilabiliaceae bacterium ANBcel2]
MRKINFLLALLTVALFWHCTSHPPISDEEINVIPLPQQVEPGNGYFILSENTSIVYDNSNEEVASVAQFIKETFAPATGYNIESATSGRRNAIRLVIDQSISGEPGVYEFESTPRRVTITAPDAAGLFYGAQTLRQLLPVQIEQLTVQTDVEWKVPAVEIYDEPSFQYRGLHLDVARHFFPVSFIKKYIDLLAFHKMNKFHWHLTEDQGWRVEIDKYPLLTEISSQRSETLIGHGGIEPFEYDGEPYGGYYTKEEMKEVVEYAKKRHITVIPEIEMPGHTLAVLAAYPELGCTGGPYEVATRWGIFDDIFCAGNEDVFTFLENVLLEVMEIFPSEYIHIGGDEAPKTRWEECSKCQARIEEEGLKDEYELQSYFIQRMEKFLNSHGRQIIGWDEILEGGLAPGATVMSWRGEDGGIESAQMGHDVIMTPNSHLYFDHYQNDPDEEPMAICCFSDLENVYSYHPVPDVLNEEEAKHILGAQANLWTEYMKTSEHVEYMAYPRAVALSEVVWTNQELRDYDDFLRRLDVHYDRLDKLNVNYFDKDR